MWEAYIFAIHILYVDCYNISPLYKPLTHLHYSIMLHTMLRLTSHIYVYCMEIVYIVNIYKQVCIYVVTYRDESLIHREANHISTYIM